MDGTSFKDECRVVFNDGSEASIACDDIVKKNGAFLLSNSRPPKRKNANYDWLHNETIIIGKQGVVKDASSDISDSKCRVQFEDGTEELIQCDDAVKGAFAYLLQEVGLNHQYFWPEAEPICAVQQSETSALNKAKDRRKTSGKRVSIKLEDDDETEPVSGHHLMIMADGHTPATEDEVNDVADSCNDPDAEFRFIGKKKVALPLPPGIPNMLWHALNCPEAKTGYNMLQEFLCVYDRVPGQDLVSYS